MITAVDECLTGKNRNAKLFLREVLKVLSKFLGQELDNSGNKKMKDNFCNVLQTSS